MRTVELAVALAILGAAACGGAGSPSRGRPGDEEGLTGIPAGATTVPVQTLLESTQSGLVEPQRTVVRTSEAWQSVWSRATANRVPAPPAPEVDFGTHMVVVVSLGRRSSGGYSVSVESASRRGDGLYVTVEEVAPEAGCFTTQALTAPVAAARVPRAAEVEFVERHTTRACS